MTGKRRNPKYVYRFLKEREHAIAFTRGEVWLSTFETLRNPENPRGDPGEGSQTTHVSEMDFSNPAHAATRWRLGSVFGGDPSGVRLHNVVVNLTHPDSFLLCTSLEQNEKMRDRFGAYCVQIADVETFAGLVGRQLASEVPLRRASMGPVRYDGRKRMDDQGMDVDIIFSNAPGNAEEQEFRMVFVPESLGPIAPRAVIVRQVAKLCRLV